MYFTGKEEDSSTIWQGLTASYCDTGDSMSKNGSSDDVDTAHVPIDKCRHHGIFRRGSFVHHTSHTWRSTVPKSTYHSLKTKFKFPFHELALSKEKALSNDVVHQSASKGITVKLLTSISSEEIPAYRHTSVASSTLEVTKEVDMMTALSTTSRKRGATPELDCREEQAIESSIQFKKRKRAMIKSWFRWKPQGIHHKTALGELSTKLTYTPFFHLSCDADSNTNDDLLDGKTETCCPHINYNNATTRISVPTAISSREYDEFTRIEYPQVNTWSFERLQELQKVMYEFPKLSFSSEINLNNDIGNLEEEAGQSTNTSGSSIDLNIECDPYDTFVKSGPQQQNISGKTLEGIHQSVEMDTEVDNNVYDNCSRDIPNCHITKGSGQVVQPSSHICNNLEPTILWETQKWSTDDHIIDEELKEQVYNNDEYCQKTHVFKYDETGEPLESDSDTSVGSVNSYEPVTILVPTIREDRYMISDLKTSILEGERIKSIYHPHDDCLSDDENKPYNIQDPRFFGVELQDKSGSKILQEPQRLYSRIKFDDFSEVVFYNGSGTLRQTTEERPVKLALQTLRSSMAFNHHHEPSKSGLLKEHTDNEFGSPESVVNEPFNVIGGPSTFNKSNLSMSSLKTQPKSILKSKVNERCRDESIKLSECDSINVVEFMKVFNEREQVRMDALDDLGDQRERQVMLYYQNVTK